MVIDVTNYIEEIKQGPAGHTKHMMLTPPELSELRRELPNYRFVNGEEHDYHQGNKQTLYHITKKVKRKRSIFHLHQKPVIKPKGSGGLGSKLNWPDRGIK